MSLNRLDISNWTDEVLEQRSFRQAVHIVLAAIAGTPDLQANMIMKGGILLSLAYEGSRFTKDIDFSTPRTLKELDIQEFIRKFESALGRAVEQLDYGLDCIVQSWRQQPPQEDADFATIRLRIGYAYKGHAAAHRRLLKKNSSQIVKVDYSLNEPLGDPEICEISEGETIQVYSFHDLIGEKLRAILQQEVRNRIRRQDTYDLYCLLRHYPSAADEQTRSRVLSSLKDKARARGLEVCKSSMANPNIIERSKAEYGNLISEISGDLPPFDEAYASVKDYYESLPWDE